MAEGVVELLGNGSAFIRLGENGETTDDDVYVSAAQVKRCELVTGDRVAGPVRAPRRSERFPSLVRVDTINGRPADEVAEGTKFEDLPAAWPSERIALGSEDVTLKAVEWLTPFGKGSRVLICGGPRAGKSELARDIVGALSGREGLELLVVLVGVRPEEVGDWSEPAPVATVTFAGSPDAQAQAVEQAVEQGRRVAARGGDAVVVIDTLEYVPPHVARRALAAARNIADGGSLTVIATAPAPFGGESTVVALDAQLTALRRFPALDLPGSGTLRADALVGDAGAEAIAKARAEAAAAALGARVRDPAPVGLGRELDRLAVALGLDVAEGVVGVVEDDVELAFLHALVEPGRAEDEPAQPVHERPLGRADQLGPAVVDVLAEAGGRVLDLAVDRQVDEVLELDALQPAADEAELAGGLLDPLGEVALVEREPEVAVLQDVILAGVVVSSAGRVVHRQGESADGPARGVCILGADPACVLVVNWIFHSASRSRRSNARTASRPVSGQSKKRRFTHVSASSRQSNACSMSNSQRPSGAPASLTAPKPARVRSASWNSATSISVAKTLCTQPM